MRKDQVSPKQQVQVPHSTIVPNRKFDKIRLRIGAMIDKEEIPSMAIAVAKDGDIIWEEALGWADREKSVRATPHTIYAIASLSKSLTATGLMILVERGQVKLDNSVEKYIAPTKLTAYEGRTGEPTIKQVLNMTGGIPHGFKAHKEPYQPLPLNEFVSRYVMVVFPPGEVEEYSNFSYSIPQLIIERVSGKSFSEFMKSEVFVPLGMTDTSVDDPHTESVATRYRQDAHTPIAYTYYFVPAGAAGFYSSVHDLIRYGMFHLGNHLPDQQQILSDEMLTTMHMDKERNLANALMALGWGSVEIEKEIVWVISNGRLDGASSMLSLVPSANLAVACLANITSHTSRVADQIAIEITDTLLPKFAEKVGTIMEQYEASRVPYKATIQFIGKWKGAINTIESAVPITLTFDDDGTVYVDLEEQLGIAMDDVSVRDGELEGEFQGRLPNEEGFQERQAIYIHMKTAGEKMYGSATARFNTEQGAFMLPHYMYLKRTRAE